MAIQNNFPAIRPTLLLDFANTGRLDPRISFTRASSATFFDQLGVLQTAASGAARFTYDPATLQPQGLLIEEQRTNSIRNNTMQGAVAGTPGTPPTNWVLAATTNGIAQEIFSVGTQNGIAYVDIKISGTATATSSHTPISFDSFTQIVASSGQAWSGASYFSIVGGSTSNFTLLVFRLRQGTAAGAFVASTDTNIANYSGNLNGNRQTVVLSSAAATTERIAPLVQIGYNNGAAIDITLRIGLPQLELGAFATSVIPTTTTALTRNADVATMTGTNFSGWYNASAGTVACDAQRSALISSSGFANLWAISDNSSNERFAAFNTGSGQTMDLAISDNGSSQGTLVAGGAITANSSIKTAFAYAVNDFAWVRAAGTVQTDTSGTLPTVDRLYIGANAIGGGQWTGTISRLSYYPQRLSNAQLQALTG